MQHIKDYCEHSGVDHTEYAKAVAYLAKTEGARRSVLLNALKKQLGVKS